MFGVIAKSFENIFVNNGLFVKNFLGGALTQTQLFDLSVIIICLSFLLLLLSFLLPKLLFRKTSEEKIAEKIALNFRLLKQGEKPFQKRDEGFVKKLFKKKEGGDKPKKKDAGVVVQQKQVDKKKPVLNLKQVLIEKFQPIIEKQLKTSVEVKDIKVSGENFLAKIIVQDHKLELVLDSSGQIIDYKRT